LVPSHIEALAQSGSFHRASIGAALIVDVEGSTALAERLRPYGTEGAEVLANMLSSTFSPMVGRVASWGGVVAEIAGDGILALFPGALDEAVSRALDVASEITEVLEALSEFETPSGPAALTFRSVVGAGTLEWRVWACDDDKAHQNAGFVSLGAAVDEARRGESITPGGMISVGPTAAARLPLSEEGLGAALSDGFVSIEGWEQGGDIPPGPIAASPGQSTLHFYPASIVEADLKGEFRDVVAVFADLKSNDPNHISEMAHVLAGLSRHRGYLNHVIKPAAERPGVRVFALWGAPTTREHDVAYALQFLDELQIAIGSENLRAGVTRSAAFTGFVGAPLQEQYTAIGPGVNLASRICTAARWGEIRVDGSIATRLANASAFEEVGAIEYRGFAEPIRTYQITEAPPAYPSNQARGQLVGRSAALEDLEDLLAPLWSGNSAGVVAIIGEAGIGKSRLVRALEDRLSSRTPPPLWIHSQADEIRTQPLATLRDAIAGYFGRPGRLETEKRLDEYLEGRGTDAPSDVRQQQRTRVALADLLNLVPDNARVAALEPQARFENVVLAIENLVGAMERSSPVIVSVADAQWIDEGTAEVLARVTTDLKGRRVVVILESRSPETGVEPDHRIDLGPLDESEIAQLVEGILEEEPPPGLVSTVAERSGGNPFFAIQLIEYLRREGSLGRPDDASIPLDMRRVLIAQLDELPDRVRRLVQTASVLGREVDLTLLEQMVGADPGFPSFVQRVVDAGIWDRVNRTEVIFSNTLIRDAAYDMILHSDLRSFHAAAAVAIEEVSEDGARRSAQLAYHYDRAGLVSAAVDQYLIAGSEAAERYDNQGALSQFERALELIPAVDRDLRLEALRFKHDIHELKGEPSLQAETIESMETTSAGDDRLTAGVLILRARLHTALGEYREAEEVVERALTMAGKEVTADRGELTFLKAQLSRYLGRIDDAISLANSAREIFTTIGQELRVATVDDFSGGIAWEIGDFEAAADLHRSAADVFASAGRVTDEVKALNNLGSAIISKGDYSKAREIHKEGAKRSREVGYRMGEGDHLDNLGGTAWAVGDLDLAVDYYTTALRIREGMGDLWGVAISKGNLGLARRALGEVHEGLALYREALEIDQRIGRRRGEAYDLHGIGLCQLDLGRNNLAAEALAGAARIRQELEEPHLANESQVAHAVAIMRRGDMAEAAELVQSALDDEGDDFFAACVETTATRLRCVEVLEAINPEIAAELRSRAKTDVVRRAGLISDPEDRRTYLEQVESHSRALLDR
jgi:class 3 adenylate cyclase/tetratricopeptide (TPR) repeat protein